jgi:hypothetical protein
MILAKIFWTSDIANAITIMKYSVCNIAIRRSAMLLSSAASRTKNDCLAEQYKQYKRLLTAHVAIEPVVWRVYNGKWILYS